MVIKRKKELEDIMKGLSLLQYYIKFSSKTLGFYDINKVCEGFFKNLFNIMYDLKLKEKKKNFPAIDLGDKLNKYSVQITVDGSKNKLEETIKKFEKNELYEKYDTLLHFIIGEKFFTENSLKKLAGIKSEEYEFKKNETDEYIDEFYSDFKITDKNNEKYIFQVIIKDIYDLLLSINNLEDAKLSRVHEYIENNINQFIEKLKRPLYNFEPTEVDEFTANSFIEYLCVETSQYEMFRNDLRKLATILSELPKNTRSFLYFAMEAYKPNRSEGIEVNRSLLESRLGIDSNQFYKEIEILQQFNLINNTALEYDGYLILHYYDSEDNEVLKDLHSYCNEYNKSLKDIITNVYFNELD